MTSIHFCEPGVKTTAKVYEETILDPVVKSLSDTLFERDNWISQQDSAPTHKLKRAQKWLENNIPNFIRHEDWPSGSPDLNPLDYNLWNIFEEEACRKCHPILEAL